MEQQQRDAECRPPPPSPLWGVIFFPFSRFRLQGDADDHRSQGRGCSGKKNITRNIRTGVVRQRGPRSSCHTADSCVLLPRCHLARSGARQRSDTVAQTLTVHDSFA